jgi:hypothetical protein
MRKLVQHILSGDYEKDWNDSVIEIWENKSEWKRLHNADG